MVSQTEQAFNIDAEGRRRRKDRPESEKKSIHPLETIPPFQRPVGASTDDVEIPISDPGVRAFKTKLGKTYTISIDDSTYEAEREKRRALSVDDVDALKAADLNGKSVEDTLTAKIATIGENMSIRRLAKLTGETVVSYVHNAAAPGMGKIGVLVAMNGGNEALGKQIAMHVAAVNPASLSEADLDPAVVEKEKQVQIDIARESGKPEQVIEKMIVGRMKKFMAEVTLVNQAFVVNPDLTVGAAAAEAGAEITGFVRLEVGEGIEKKEEDFAAEVAKAVKG